MNKKLSHKKSNSSKNEKIVYALQGGGALGAYQVGVLDSLEKAGYEPSWLAGTSIGAINAAIMAGNKPKNRLKQLYAFWDKITTKNFCFDSPYMSQTSRRLYNFWSAFHTFCFGQEGFFKPRHENPLFMLSRTVDEISFYDFSELKKTLEEFVDFDLINSGDIRLSVGAVQIDTGKQIYFDNTPISYPVGTGVEIKQCTIGPEHIMASSALPPGFPAVEIDNEMYWDGGVYCNTPLAIVLGGQPKDNILCFMVHLFDSYGIQPESFDNVMKRHKDISYSSNYRALIQMHRTVYNLRHTIYELYQKIPDELKSNTDIKEMGASAREPTTNIVRLHYHGKDTQWSSKDAEFSHVSIKEHIQSGIKDMNDALDKSPWFKPIPQHIGIVIHEMTKDPMLKKFFNER